MTNRAIQLFNQLRPVSVGFDNVFDHFERMFEDDFITNMPSFPHYNIVKTGENKYDIEIALAGYNKKDIEVEVADGVLTVRSVKESDNEADEWTLHRGISYRKFNRKFTLADDIVVNDAKLENGLLSIELEQIVPEEKKPRLIKIK